MIFVLLTFMAAFLIEGLGTLVSVIGLSTLFGANPIIIALAVALDIGKLVVVSLLYTYWKKLGFLMKSYALLAATVTMIITSAGAAGYLSGEFQKAVIGTQEIGLKVGVLKEEQAKLEARKKQIDDQIANLPANYSRARISLMKQFEAEQKQVTARLTQIQEELPKMQVDQISVEAKAGPILYIAKAFDIPVEQAVKWVILMIIFVFDPLAVFLIIAGNFLLHQRRVHKAAKVSDADLFEEKPRAVTEEQILNEEFAALDNTPTLRVPEKAASLAQINQTFKNDLSGDRNMPLGSPEWEAAMDKGYPDTAETKTWTRDEAIAEGWPDHALMDAGWEPRAPMEAPTAPIFEVLQPTPVSPSDAPEPAPQFIDQPDENASAPEPVVTRTPEEREQITLDRLRAASGPYRSILNDVSPDDSVTFEDNPRQTASRTHYSNYNR